jgi:arsenate reductase
MNDAVAPIRVIFVCTHNSARSVMGEALLRRHGGDAFEVVSAGTEPGRINPLTLRALGEAGLPTDGYRSKSVNEFIGHPFDFVITVCDEARQSCPVFPGGRRTLHWGYPDPSEAIGTDEERLRAFRSVLIALGERIAIFVPIALRERDAAAAGTAR